MDIRLRAVALYSGIGAQQKCSESLALLQSAEEEGDFLARMWLAQTYYIGRNPRELSDIKTPNDEFLRFLSGSLKQGYQCQGLVTDQSRGVFLAEQPISQVVELAESGSIEAQFLAGSAFKIGLSVDVDLGRAVALIKDSCERGFLLSCHSLAVLYYEDKSTNEDRSHAVALLQKACDGGFMLACSNLGDLYFYGSGGLVARDPSLRRQLYQKACERGNLWGCTQVALKLANERPSSLSDFSRIAQLLQRACDGGEPFACVTMTNLGQRYYDKNTLGDVQGLLRVAQLFKNSCNSGHL